LFAGCTVNVSDGNSDGGLDETGGMSGTGGAVGNTGGSTSNVGGNANGGNTFMCPLTFDESVPQQCGAQTPTNVTCDACLQEHDCSAAYVACYQTPCITIISSMQDCMASAFDNSTTGVLPDDAESKCLTTVGLDNPTTADAINAKALWTEINSNLFCNEVCCAVITSH
jgi:hypothetical protein